MFYHFNEYEVEELDKKVEGNSTLPHPPPPIHYFVQYYFVSKLCANNESMEKSLFTSYEKETMLLRFWINEEKMLQFRQWW